GARNSPGSRGSEPSRLALAGVTPVINVLERRASGLWRSGSASHWQCGGRGFESRQLHQSQQLSIGVVPRRSFVPRAEVPERASADERPFVFLERRST